MKPSRSARHVSPVLVAIVGGSGSGKTWLADKLLARFSSRAGHLSQDDFYRDRSHLSAERRAKLNFDHPRAIDWRCLENALRDLAAGREAHVPDYDFATHSRRKRLKTITPKPLLVVDGLWLLRRPSIRRLFRLSVFLDCSTRTRLLRRVARDLISRGRTRASVRGQFWRTVEPMHVRYVAPQARCAEVVLKKPCSHQDVHKLAQRISLILASLKERTFASP
jgi:uridine kinase